MANDVSGALGWRSLHLLVHNPEDCWRLARRVENLTGDFAEVAKFTDEQWMSLIHAQSNSDRLNKLAEALWTSGRVVVTEEERKFVDSMVAHDLQSRSWVTKDIRLVSDLLLAAKGFMLACSSHAAKWLTSNTYFDIRDGTAGLLAIALGAGGSNAGFLRFIASFMPEHLVRSTGTQIMGGNGGSPFIDKIEGVGPIHTVEIQCGARIDGIRVLWRDPRHPGQIIHGDHHGGRGGSLMSIGFKEGEVLTRVSGRSGHGVDQLTLHTSLGKYGPFGGNGGSPFEITPEWGARIVGFQGRAGEMIDAIGGVSEVYGSAQAGGMGGIPFLDALPEGGRINRVVLRAGGYLDSIQIIHDVGGAERAGHRHGGGGGGEHRFDLGPNEIITRVWGKCGTYVDRINFDIVDTATGATRLEYFGGDGGEREFDLRVPDGKRLTGFWGRAGEYVDAIGLCVG